MDNLSGQMIGRYRILEPLGRGGMAIVYKAYDTRLECDVAIKFIRQDEVPPSNLDRLRKRFEREAKMLAKLTHANIIKVIDYGEYEGSPYLVMEYVSGGTLAGRMGKPFPVFDAVKLLLPITRALEYAHQQGMVHRDVKPSNVLITASGDPLLTDFGIACILEGEGQAKLTITGMGIGTPEYMSPEQGMGKEVDGRSDIYALGIIFYELLTGRRPFTGDTPMSVIIQHIKDPLPSPRMYIRDLSKQVEKVLYDALAKDPDKRFSTMGAFAKELESLITLNMSKNQNTKLADECVSIGTNDELEPISIDSSASGACMKTVNIPAKNKPLPFGAWLFGLIGLAVGLITLVAVINGLWFSGMRSNSPTPTLERKDVTLPMKSSSTMILKPELTVTLSPAPTQRQTPTLNLTTTETATIIPGSTITSEIDGMVLVYIPAGEFFMGSADIDANADTDEKPQHLVYLDAFWVDQTEVTNKMYQQCVEAGRCETPEVIYYYRSEEYSDHPMVNVNWFQADDYCLWAGRRLLTEAEWEKAARGTEGFLYPWGDGFDCKNGNFDDEILYNQYVIPGGEGCDGYNRTAPVGSFTGDISVWGVKDLAGNVTEWVADIYGENFYLHSKIENPTGPENGDARVARGGAWINSNISLIRSADRYFYMPDRIKDYLGFRCGVSIPADANDPSEIVNFGN